MLVARSDADEVRLSILHVGCGAAGGDGFYMANTDDEAAVRAVGGASPFVG